MKKKKLPILLAGFIGLTCLAGCNLSENAPVVEEEETQEREPVDNRVKNIKISNNDDVTKYIKDQQFDPDQILAFDLTPKVKASKDSSGNLDGNKLVVVKKTERDAMSGTGELHALEQGESIFPGQLLLADEGLVNGSPTELSSLTRGQGIFDISLPGLSDSEFKVNVTKFSKVRNGIADKVDEWVNLPKKRKLTAKQTFKIVEAFDQSQVAVDFGFKVAERLGINSEYKQDTEKHTFIVSFEQIFYTVKTSFYGSDTVVFDDEVTKEDIATEIGNVPPVIVSQASYGKMIFFKIETTKNKAQIDAGFKYAGSVDVDAKAKFQAALEDSSITALVYGGAVDEEPTPTPITDTSDNKSSDQINQLISYSLASTGEDVANAVLLSYKTSWLKNNKTAKIMSTSKYVETTRTVINEQKVTVKNIGAYEVKKWHIKARPVTVNKETGDIEFGDLVTLHTAEHIAACQDRTYLIPGNYGQIEFHYDITWGSLWPYAGRIDTNDFIGEAKIETGGTTFHNWVRFNIDGRTREV